MVHQQKKNSLTNWIITNVTSSIMVNILFYGILSTFVVHLIVIIVKCKKNSYNSLKTICIG